MPLSSVTADHALHLDRAIVQIYGPFTVQTYPVSASEEFQTKMQRSLGLSLITAQLLIAPRVQWVIPSPEFAPWVAPSLYISCISCIWDPQRLIFQEPSRCSGLVTFHSPKLASLSIRHQLCLANALRSPWNRQVDDRKDHGASERSVSDFDTGSLCLGWY